MIDVLEEVHGLRLSWRWSQTLHCWAPRRFTHVDTARALLAPSCYLFLSITHSCTLSPSLFTVFHTISLSLSLSVPSSLCGYDPCFLFSLAFFLSIVPPCISFYPSFTLSFFSLSLSFSWPESLHHTFIYRPQSLPSLNLTFFLFCHPSPIISLSLSLSLSPSLTVSPSLPPGLNLSLPFYKTPSFFAVATRLLSLSLSFPCYRSWVCLRNNNTIFTKST